MIAPAAGTKDCEITIEEGPRTPPRLVDNYRAELQSLLYGVYVASSALEKKIKAHGVSVHPTTSGCEFKMDTIAGQVVSFIASHAEQYLSERNDNVVIAKPMPGPIHTANIESLESLVKEGVFYFNFLRAVAAQSGEQSQSILLSVPELEVPDVLQKVCATPAAFFSDKCIRARYNLGGHPAIRGAGGTCADQAAEEVIFRQSELTPGVDEGPEQSAIASFDQMTGPSVDGERQACGALPSHTEQLMHGNSGPQAGREEIERLQEELQQANKERVKALNERNRALQAGEEKIEQLKAGKEKIRQLKEELRQANSRHEGELKEQYWAIQEGNDEIRKLSDKLKEVSQQCSEARERGDQALTDLLGATQQLQELQAQHREMQARLEEGQSKHERAGAEIERLKRQISELRHNDLALREQESVYRAQLEQRDMRIQNLQKQFDEVQRENQRMRALREAHGEALANQKARVLALEKRCEVLSVTDLEHQIALRTQAESEVQELRARLEHSDERNTLNEIRLEAQRHKLAAQEYFRLEILAEIRQAALDKRLPELLDPTQVVELLQKLAQVKYDLGRYTELLAEQERARPEASRHKKLLSGSRREIA